MADALAPRSDVFVTIPGDRHSEVGRNLAEPVPKALSLVDQLGLWGNLGVSLLGFTGAIFVLQPNGTGTPELSMLAGLSAVVLGTLLGTVPLALAGVAGARTGAPAMVLLRGLFGARLSYLPTVLNILQCVGWGIFELVTIATAAHRVAPALPKWGYVTIAGVVTAVLAVRPLGFIRTLRRYVTQCRRRPRVPFPRACSPPVARFDTRHLVGFLGGDRQGRRRGDLVRSPWRLTTPDTPAQTGQRSAARSLATASRRSFATSSACWRSSRSRETRRHLRRVHRRAGRHARLRDPGGP